MESKGFINGEKIFLRKLRDEDLNENYLGWLNDPKVLEYRESPSRVFPTSIADLKSWYDGLRDRATDILHFAICLKASDKHVGNIDLNPIQWIHHRAALNILLGDRSVWGQRIGADAISTLTRHAFMSMGLRQVWAESSNPAFNRVVRTLGWVKEGVKREAFLHKGSFIDYECHSILLREWQKMNFDHSQNEQRRNST